MEAAALLAEALQLALDQHLHRKKEPRLMRTKEALSNRVYTEGIRCEWHPLLH